MALIQDGCRRLAIAPGPWYRNARLFPTMQIVNLARPLGDMARATLAKQGGRGGSSGTGGD
jgi:hypothetical protein